MAMGVYHRGCNDDRRCGPDILPPVVVSGDVHGAHC